MSGAILTFCPDLKSRVLEMLPFNQEAAVAARDLVPYFPGTPINYICQALSTLHKWPDVKRQKTTMRTLNGGCTGFRYWRLPP